MVCIQGLGCRVGYLSKGPGGLFRGIHEGFGV